jgi:hypothetical protein
VPRFSTALKVRVPLISVAIGIQTQPALAGFTSITSTESVLGVICTKRRDMGTASLTHILAPVVDDHVVGRSGRSDSRH